nr:hypothetical protein [Tanacetum cinerariifolium]
MDVENALKARDVLCVSCAKNVLIMCHDKCLANYKLNVHSKVRRALFTTSRTVKSKLEDTTPMVQIVLQIVDSGCSKHMTGNNDDDESSNNDDDDDDVEKDEEDKEEEEHLALADPSDISTDDLETMTTVNQGMSVEEIERVVAKPNDKKKRMLATRGSGKVTTMEA